MKVIGIVQKVDQNNVDIVSSMKLKTGDFVCYQDRWVSEDRYILCRVGYSQSLKTYEDEFLIDIEVNPRDILTFSGMDTEDFDRYLITASIIGYFDDRLKEFKHPRAMPDSGETIYLAEEPTLKDISKVKAGYKGSAVIGNVLGTDVPVALSVKDVVSQHLSIIAATGSGKSYTVGVLLEELMKPATRAAVLVVDPHGEYATMAGVQNIKEFTDGDYRPQVRVFRKENIKIKITELELDDFLSILDMTEKMQSFFIQAYNNLPDRSNYKKIDLKNEIALLKTDMNESTIEGILWRYDSNILRKSIFDDFQHVPLKEQFNVGQLSILDLSGLSQREQQLITAVLLKRLFEARQGTLNGHMQEKDDKYLPYPVFVVLEEAHRFAPQNGETKSKGILKTILSEGRKFGIGVGMVSQRPAKLDSDCLSQCMTQITMKVINPVDQGQIASSLESMSRDIIDQLPALAKGEAVISGVAINTPTIVKIRSRLTEHGGISPDAPEEWASYWKKSAPLRVQPKIQRDQYKLF